MWIRLGVGVAVAAMLVSGCNPGRVSGLQTEGFWATTFDHSAREATLAITLTNAGDTDLLVTGIGESTPALSLRRSIPARTTIKPNGKVDVELVFSVRDCAAKPSDDRRIPVRASKGGWHFTQQVGATTLAGWEPSVVGGLCGDASSG